MQVRENLFDKLTTLFPESTTTREQVEAAVRQCVAEDLPSYETFKRLMAVMKR